MQPSKWEDETPRRYAVLWQDGTPFTMACGSGWDLEVQWLPIDVVAVAEPIYPKYAEPFLDIIRRIADESV